MAWGKKESFIADVRPLIRAMGLEWFMREEVLFGGLRSSCLDCGRKKKLCRRHRREMMRRDSRVGSSIDCFSAVTLIFLEYCEVIKRAARFCTDSSSLARYACDGFQMDDAYSSFGRT